jgi:hypothetical protein
MMEARRQREIGIATSFGQNLHFRVNSTKSPAGRIRQRKVPVNECIAWLIRSLFHREAAVAKCKLVAENCQHLPGILGGIRLRHAVVQMNFNLAPPGTAVIGEHLKEAFIVLFSGIEVSVDKRPAIVVAPPIDGLGILPAPAFQTAHLLGTGNAFPAIFGINGRLEVVRHRDHQMHRPARGRAQRAPSRARQNPSRVRDFLLETHCDLQRL